MVNFFTNIFKMNANKIAYSVNNYSITYDELLNKVMYYSDLLKREGNSPVLIYGNKNINMIISMFSCIFANRAYVIVNSNTPLNRINEIKQMTNSTLFIKNEDIDFKNSLTLNELDKFKDLNYKINNNEIIYIIFTSGSTGKPKGVPISKNNLFNFIDWISKVFKGYHNINVLNQANFSFDLSVADIFYSLSNGHTLIGLDTNEYNEIFNVILNNNINLMVVTPTFMKMCLLNKDFNFNNFKDLKCVYFCGELLDVKLVNKLFLAFPNLKIINAYGPTEATSAVSSIEINKSMLANNLLPVGEIDKAATDIIIEDNEIVLKGKSVFNGYLDNIVNGYFIQNNVNCYRTGDLGFIKDNLLFCTGRKDSQIKFKGYRIELNDIEFNINKIKGVIDDAVIAKTNDEGIVKTIVAYVVLEDDYNTLYVKDELTKLIPNYMIPKIIKKIDKLPVNKNGKIDRKVLKNYD